MDVEDEADLKAEETKNKTKMSLPEPSSKIKSESEKPKVATEIESASENEEEESESDGETATESESESENEGELSLAKAMSQIDASHLAAFLAGSPRLPGREVWGLVEYFGEALSGVSSVHFPWPKMDKLVDVINHPLSQVSDTVYLAAASFIQQVDHNSVAGFILSAIDFILASVAGTHSPTSHLAVFVTLSIVLRSKRGAFSMILPLLRMMWPYTSENKLPIILWMIAQVSAKDLTLGFYSWSYNLLPLAGEKQKCDPQSMDLILQLVEHIVSYPNGRTILVNNSVQEGVTRLISPPSFEILLRVTFPASSERTKDTERFEAIYPLLKELALADTPGKEAMKQLSQQIFTFSLKLAGEGNPVLAKEATSIAIWCLTKNVDCCNHWDSVYNDNPEASVALLRRLVDEWKDHSHKLSSSPSDTLTLNRTMKSFMVKNTKHTTEGGANASLYKEANKYSKDTSWRLSRASFFVKGIAISAVLLYKEADKYSKVISGRLSRRSGFLTGIAISAVLLVAAVAAAPVVLSSNLVGSFDPHEYINAIITALNN